jgi:hypothetical protein
MICVRKFPDQAVMIKLPSSGWRGKPARRECVSCRENLFPLLVHATIVVKKNATRISYTHTIVVNISFTLIASMNVMARLQK